MSLCKGRKRRGSRTEPVETGQIFSGSRDAQRKACNAYDGLPWKGRHKELRADGSLPLGPIFDRRVELDYVPSRLNRAQVVSKNLQHRGKVNGQSTLSRHLTE